MNSKEREAEYEAEQIRIKKDKEKEVARLRALQERDRDHKAEQVKSYSVINKYTNEYNEMYTFCLYLNVYGIIHLEYQFNKSYLFQFRNC